MRRNDVPREVVDALRTVPLFKGCSARELRRVAGLGTGVKVRAGERLTREGGPGNEFFVVCSGEASCSRAGREVARFGPGDWFGEGALLDGGWRSATVRAETAMEVVVFDSREFSSLRTDTPAVGQRIEESSLQRQGGAR